MLNRRRLLGCGVIAIAIMVGCPAIAWHYVRQWLDADQAFSRMHVHSFAAKNDAAGVRWIVRLFPDALMVKYNEHSGYLPIHTAVKSSSLDVVRELVSLGCPLDVEDASGETPLYLACRQKDANIASFLIKEGARVNAWNGRNPLHATALMGGDSTMALLIANGADVQLKERGRTALHVAGVSQQRRCVNLLLKNGSKLETESDDGLTVLDEVVLWDDPEMLDFLIELGARRTLLFALREGDIAAVGGFLDKNPKLIRGGRGLDGSTPLHYAAKFGKLELCKYLLERGADRAAQDHNGFIAAHRACQQNNKDILRLVCTKELANFQRHGWGTPLSFCASHNNVALARILIEEFNADVNVREEFGYTPLLRASERRHAEFCKLMILSGAEINVAPTPSYKSFTPLHYAVFDPWNPELTELLLSRGADPHAKKGGHSTPWEIAQRNNKIKALFMKYVKDR